MLLYVLFPPALGFKHTTVTLIGIKDWVHGFWGCIMARLAWQVKRFEVIVYCCYMAAPQLLLFCSISSQPHIVWKKSPWEDFKNHQFVWYPLFQCYTSGTEREPILIVKNKYNFWNLIFVEANCLLCASFRTNCQFTVVKYFALQDILLLV